MKSLLLVVGGGVVLRGPLNATMLELGDGTLLGALLIRGGPAELAGTVAQLLVLLEDRPPHPVRPRLERPVQATALEILVEAPLIAGGVFLVQREAQY